MCDGRRNSVAFSDIGLNGFMAGPLWRPAIALTWAGTSRFRIGGIRWEHS
jgi:hypothetical protein